jgi:hypothetical protein
LKGAYNKKKRKYSPLAETKNAGLTQDPWYGNLLVAGAYVMYY